jgi:hypothetical protein
VADLFLAPTIFLKHLSPHLHLEAYGSPFV